MSSRRWGALSTAVYLACFHTIWTVPKWFAESTQRANVNFARETRNLHQNSTTFGEKEPLWFYEVYERFTNMDDSKTFDRFLVK